MDVIVLGPFLRRRSTNIVIYCFEMLVGVNQFFPDIVSFSEEAANEGLTVVISALDGTFQRKVSIYTRTSGIDDISCEVDSALMHSWLVYKLTVLESFQPFPNISELLPLCDQVTKLSAVCSRCKNSAAFSSRTVTDAALNSSEGPTFTCQAAGPAIC